MTSPCTISNMSRLCPETTAPFVVDTVRNHHYDPAVLEENSTAIGDSYIESFTKIAT